jgi:hypothetical protein
VPKRLQPDAQARDVSRNPRWVAAATGLPKRLTTCTFRSRHQHQRDTDDQRHDPGDGIDEDRVRPLDVRLADG